MSLTIWIREHEYTRSQGPLFAIWRRDRDEPVVKIVVNC